MIYPNINRNKLHQELVDAGIDTTKLIVKSIDNTEIGADITFADSVDIVLAQKIIDSHNPTPLPIVSVEEVLKAQIEIVTINTLLDLGAI